MTTKSITVGGRAIQVAQQTEAKGRKLTVRPHSRDGGLSLYHFLFDLFGQNEIQKPKLRLNDAEIAEVVKDQFAGFPEVAKSIDESRSSRIALWRSLFNRGSMGDPPVCSFRYNDQGEAVDTQTGNTVLSIDDQAEIATRYNIADPRFQKRKSK